MRLLVDLTIHEEKFDLFNSIAQEMVVRSQSESGALEYDWFLSNDHRRCRIVEAYADSDALLAHFTGPVVQQLVPKLAEHARVDRAEVYGDLDPKSVAILTQFGAEIFASWHSLKR